MFWRTAVETGMQNYTAVFRSQSLARGFQTPALNCSVKQIRTNCKSFPLLHSAFKQQGQDVRIQYSGRCLASSTEVSDVASASGTSASSSPQNIVKVLQERGLVDNLTSEDMGEVASSQQLRVYCGFDPTADSLHLGNLLGIIVMSWFQRCGHAPVALIGGATGRVGDPSGKSAERPILSEDEINKNCEGITNLLSDIFARNSGDEVCQLAVTNNLNWFGEMKFLTFLRDVGKYARVGTMLSKESVKKRVASEAGISYTEFTYQLLQGYDFFHLCENEGISVQVGGSDQWGNITAGTELVKKLWKRGEEPPPVFGLTFPLLLDSEGKKFGKSEGGALWLSADKLSPYKFYQYLFSTTDADVVRFLRILTFLPIEEITALEESMSKADYVPNSLQRRLAEEVTRFVHGQEGLDQALKATEALRPGSDTKLDAASLEAISGDAPTASLPRDQIVGALLADVMVSVKLQPSKSAVRRMAQGGGIRLNNVQVKDFAYTITEEDVIDGRVVLLAAGKKNKLLLKVE